MLLSFIITTALVVLLVVKVELSERLLDLKSAELLYSDSAYSDTTEDISDTEDIQKTENQPKNNRYNSPTFTNEFDESSFTQETSMEDATQLLDKIYREGRNK